MVLQRLADAGVKLKKEKCTFCAPSVKYLGHQIDAAGLHPLPDKVKAIVEAPQPKNLQELRSYLGLLNYYEMFIPNLSNLLAPLNLLMKKGVVYVSVGIC